MDIKLKDEKEKDQEFNLYYTKLENLLDCCYGFPYGCTKVFDFLYLGGEDEAKDKNLIKKLGITHVINCASTYVCTGSKYYGNTLQKYVEFEAEDEEDYNMLQHFNEAYEAIESAKDSQGKALIHCVMGINRSGVLAVAYTMVYKRWGPITAARFVKDARKRVLSNDAFR
ncbi:hypothetical protein HELRODRAFT_161909 [Helobdella robusta]|uniref:protein-serine/threonine phosphatase n=1 Tax=Helobdella robusta TaxID=6412 RepID=T1ES13_HELRO|nr:hypothetical protein HELRODRAFT_161909 [Helobdella robusta]ESO02621.1 hypothetical protein HELRODRAFT_161909 [Helobdella robusta]